MCADRLEEISPLRVKSLFFKPFSENIEIARNERTCVHFHLVKVGEIIILSDLVRYYRLVRNITAVCGAQLYRLHPCAILYLYRISALVLRAVFASDYRIIIVSGIRLVRLDMTERCVTHSIRASEKSVTGKSYPCKKILLRNFGRPELEVV